MEDFKSNFIPESFPDAKQKEFLMIKQTWGSEGRETVAEYTTLFDRLLPYGGPQFQDPVIQRNHYLRYLRHHILHMLSGQVWENRESIYQAALRIERTDQEIHEESLVNRDGRSIPTSSFRSRRVDRFSQTQTYRSSLSPSPPVALPLTTYSTTPSPAEAEAVDETWSAEQLTKSERRRSSGKGVCSVPVAARLIGQALPSR
ncbi:hypothetical protein LINPERHAP1_LOCUS16085 [Linum perenne]